MDIKKIKKDIKSNFWTKNLIYYPYLLAKKIVKIIFAIAVSLSFITFFMISSYLFFKKKKKKSILFLVEGDPKKGLSPATRFRVYQYIDYLKRDGFQCKISPSKPYKYFNAHFRFRQLKKEFPLLTSIISGAFLLIMIFNRIRDLILSRSFDIVFFSARCASYSHSFFRKMY